MNEHDRNTCPICRARQERAERWQAEYPEFPAAVLFGIMLACAVVGLRALMGPM